MNSTHIYNIQRLNLMKKEKFEPWPHRKSGPIFTKEHTTSGKILYYRTINNINHHTDQVVSEICLGERYAYLAPGLLFYNETYRGSYINNWHGFPGGSLTEIIRWLLEAEYPEYEYNLWMVKSDK